MNKVNNVKFLFVVLLVALQGSIACQVMAEPTEAAKFTTLLEVIQDDITAGEAKEGYTYYKDEYRHYETLWWYKIAAWMVEDSVERHYVDKQPLGRVLDLGCGFGTLLAYASTIYGAEGVCLDVNNYLFPEFQKKYRINYVQSDIERGALPAPEKFTVVVMTEVIEHLNFHPLPTLKKIHATLAKDGSFFLSTPDANAGWGRTHKYYKRLADLPPVDTSKKWIDDHIWQYNEQELKKVLTDAGFKIKRIDHTYVPSDGGRLGHFNIWLTK